MVNSQSVSWISVIPARSFVLTTTEANRAPANMRTQGCAGQGSPPTPAHAPRQAGGGGSTALARPKVKCAVAPDNGFGVSL